MPDQPPPPPATPSSGGSTGGSQPANPYQPRSATKKQGLPWWAWAGIGCGCLVIVVALSAVFLFGWGAKKVAELAGDLENDPAAAVELMVRMNPEIEVVETDREAGKITVRDKDTGEVATFDFSEIKQGKITFEGKEGKATFSADGEEGKMEFEGADGEKVRIGAGVELEDVPGWVELYPGATAQGGATSQSSGESQGWISLATEDSPDEAETFYQDFFDGEGWEVNRSTMSSEGSRVVVLNGSSPDGSRELVASISKASDQPTQVMLRYASRE